MLLTVLCLFASLVIVACNTTNNDPNKYTVTFDTNGGTTSNFTVSVKSGDKVARPADPSKTDALFIDWSTDKTTLTSFDFNTAITKDITLYAHYGTVADARQIFEQSINRTIANLVNVDFSEQLPISGTTTTMERQFKANFNNNIATAFQYNLILDSSPYFDETFINNQLYVSYRGSNLKGEWPSDNTYFEIMNSGTNTPIYDNFVIPTLKLCLSYLDQGVTYTKTGNVWTSSELVSSDGNEVSQLEIVNGYVTSTTQKKTNNSQSQTVTYSTTTSHNIVAPTLPAGSDWTDTYVIKAIIDIDNPGDYWNEKYVTRYLQTRLNVGDYYDMSGKLDFIVVGIYLDSAMTQLVDPLQPQPLDSDITIYIKTEPMAV